MTGGDREGAGGHDLDGDLLAFTGDDPAAAQLLRTNLARLRDQLADDPTHVGLRRGVDAVLSGRMGLRELAADPAFVALTRDGMRQAQDVWAELTPEQRAAARTP